MFLSFWNEYLNFFIVLFSTIAGIVIIYAIYVLRTRHLSHNDEEFDGSSIRQSFREKTEDEQITQEDEEIHEDDIKVPNDLPEIITGFSDRREDSSDDKAISSNLQNADSIENTNKKDIAQQTTDIQEDKPKSKKKTNDFERLEETLRSIEEGEEEEEKSSVDIAFESDDEDDKKTGKRYHVLYRKDDNKWYVKREGTDKITKVLESQKEAIAFATIKAINQSTTVVVHKRDGKIRKYSL